MVEKYIIDKSDISDLLKGDELPLTQGRARAFQVEVAGHMTNGELTKALFPNAKNIKVDGGYPLNYIIEGEWHRNLKEWWDKPYGMDER